MRILLFTLQAVAGTAAMLLVGVFVTQISTIGQTKDRNNFMRAVGHQLWEYRDEHGDDLRQDVGDKDHPHSWRVQIAMRFVQRDERSGRAARGDKYEFQSNWDEKENISGELRLRFADRGKTTSIMGLFDENGNWFARVRTGTQHGRKSPPNFDRHNVDPVVLIFLSDSGVFWNEPVDIVAHRGSNTLTLRGKPLPLKRLSGCAVVRLSCTTGVLPVTESEEVMFDALLSPDPISDQDRHPARLPGEDDPEVAPEPQRASGGSATPSEPAPAEPGASVLPLEKTRSY